ncbi:type I polyketide synthase [Streptomyces sp. NBC_00728]|uniref:type I polyketide synthase n=1 Tax=Streptomyces sp. NBC_00728 TaxID=2903676 RepID=UPI0038650EC2
MSHDNTIAIVGMACRFPGAGDVAEFWANLRAGADGISRYDRAELLAAGVPPSLADHPDYVAARGSISGGDTFDRHFFGYSAAEAESIDPQQRVFLSCASQALDDAGLDPERETGLIGVYAGCDVSAPQHIDRDDPSGATVRIIGSQKDFLATRVAYKLNLRGPALTVQTACSTSLVAVHQAARALLGYECDVALAGGVNVRLPEAGGYLYQRGNILSRDGRCRTFDAEATGTVSSSGVGVVVLKRLDDALENGDRIVALIRGSAVNNDGGAKIGFTAPSVTGQRDVIAMALAQAGAEAGGIGYVEAHGTGTRLGDPIEVAALTAAFRESTDRTGYCKLGAVKANIGHTGAAAGVAGLIKTALMLRHRTFVPTPHFTESNPELKLAESPFEISTRDETWLSTGPRLAGVSSFGIGGTNAHVVMEEPPALPAVRPDLPGEAGSADEGAAQPQALCLSAASAQALRTLSRQVAERLTAQDAPELADAVRTLEARRRFPHRRTVVATTREQAAVALLGDPGPGVRAAAGTAAAFLFPGQGALRAGHARAAYEKLPVFREVFDECAAHAGDRFGADLSALLNGADADWFTDTRHQQLGLFVLGYGLARQLGAWDIRPVAMFGHSIGEYAAATLAGLWTLPEALSVVWARGQAMRDTAPGRMLALRCGEERVRTLLNDEVALAVAGGDHVVLSGPVDRIEEIALQVQGEGVTGRLLRTEHAFHSPMMAPAAQALREAVAATSARTPSMPFVSGLTGAWADLDAVRTPGYWADQLLGAVRLHDGLRTVAAEGARLLVELGPGDQLSRQARRTVGDGALAVPFLGRDPEQEDAGVLEALGRLWEHGIEVPWRTLPKQRTGRLVELPPHPLAATRYAEPAGPGAPAAPRPAALAPTTSVAAQAARHGHPRAAASPAEDSAGTTLDAVRELWCEALGATAARDEDDFHTLGGESLLLVHLLARIRERTGVSIAAAETSSGFTFGRLAELVRQAAPGPSHPAAPDTGFADIPDLTLLREGMGTPLFLMAPAAGTTLCYRHLVSRLAGDRPVYGIESPRPAPGDRALNRLEDIAAHHVRVLRQVQPEGPYVLGGWSFGAMTGHEMARQLAEAGQRVALLLAVDGFMPHTHGRPVATRAGWLREALALQLRALAARGRAKLRHERPTRDGAAPEGRVARIEELAAAADGSGAEHVRIHNANLTATLRHRPRPVPGGLVLLKAAADSKVCRRLQAHLAPLYGGEVSVTPVPGDHWSVLSTVHADAVAALIDPHLAALD